MHGRRLLRRACSCVLAIDKHTHPWRSIVNVAPLTIAKLLQQRKSLELEHTFEIHPHPHDCVNNNVLNLDKEHKEWAFKDILKPSKIEVYHSLLKQRQLVLDKHGPLNVSSGKDVRSCKEIPQFGRKWMHSHNLEQQHGSNTLAFAPLAIAYSTSCASPCASNLSCHATVTRGRSYSQRADKPDDLFSKLPGMGSAYETEDKQKKVTVVGVGNVGMACAQTILTDNLTDAIALVDVDPDKLRGEMLDLQHAAAFMPTVSILASIDYKITANSDVCIITAGARQREGEDRLSLVDRNVQVFKQIIPKLVQYSPNTIFLVISNPVDILSWVTWKLSGFPPNRVIGTGTNLDSSRFRHFLATHFKVSAQNVHANILGEHGDSSVPVWSSVDVAGVPVTAHLLNKGVSNDKEVLKEAHQAVVDGAYEVIRLKGYTSWAIGYSAAGLVSSILRNQRRVHPVSVMAQGFHGIKQEVYISLPAMLGRLGVHGVVNSKFSNEEIKQLHESAAQMWDIQSKVKL